MFLDGAIVLKTSFGGRKASWIWPTFFVVLGILAATGIAIWVGGLGASRAMAPQPAATRAHLPLPVNSPASGPPLRVAPITRESVDPISAGKSDPELARLEKLIRENSPNSLLVAAKILGQCVANETLARQSPGSIAPQPFCRLVNHSYFRERLKWIEVAIDARLPGAGTEWVRQGPNGSLIDPYQRPDDPLIGAWKSRALEILNEEAKRGDVEAIGSLLIAYSKLGIAGFDAARMHAYQKVLWEIKDPANASKYIANLEATSRISQQNIAIANEIAAKLLTEIREHKK